MSRTTYGDLRLVKDSRFVGLTRYRVWRGTDYDGVTLWSDTPWFLDKEQYETDPDYRYTILGSGMAPSGIAQTFGHARTLTQAVEKVRLLMQPVAPEREN